MIQAHLDAIPKLMKAIRLAIDRDVKLAPDNKQAATGAAGAAEEAAATAKQTRVRVIVLTSGSTGMEVGGVSIDTCIQRFNRASTIAAHKYGFAVLDRGEIEHRLMAKSTLSPQPILNSDMHLPQPGQNLIATTLLHLMTCLDKNASNYKIDAEVLENRQKHTHNGGAATPLHSPPH
eukprot:CAMPEP_0170414504 /NCGR_PEP_ID=MMETSP0117_2-20130122/32102_1 /TAXON_ID=400756 /ORGANISM="Durinskia baltica, Strain CSIRO CS-38" /LENGTH=176 /DNA_ID=CAMNT_0010672395 /DNA_START=159 /DNA_END=689 /DNA_ORIENTATION=-